MYVHTDNIIHNRGTHTLLLLTILVRNYGAVFAKQAHGANQTVLIVPSSLCEVAKYRFL